MRLRGRAGGPVIELARLGLGQRDEFRQRARRHLGVDRKQQRVLDQDGDRLEIALEVEAELRVERRIDRERGRHDQQRVAVRRRLGDGVGADHRARARAVLDDDRLAERFLEVWLQQPRHDVLRRAGLRGHDDADRPARIVVRLRVGGAGQREERDGHADEASVRSAQAEKWKSTCVQLHCDRSGTELACTDTGPRTSRANYRPRPGFARTRTVIAAGWNHSAAAS